MTQEEFTALEEVMIALIQKERSDHVEDVVSYNFVRQSFIDIFVLNLSEEIDEQEI